ncbi:hypothetical protein [Halofilum ochraceum]|uniref:hypothetical protein n=1 Tax=Halofilum ochraceum TaxID=1611323 RepID=UPI001FE02C89|nr:hypothetical protein [Halofilum ochraceum]
MENEGRRKRAETPNEVVAIRNAEQIIGEYAVALRRIRMLERSSHLFDFPATEREQCHEYSCPTYRRC